MVLDREGAGGRGRRGRKTCPISAPLPDLMLALPFSSPCSLRGSLLFCHRCEIHSPGTGSAARDKGRVPPRVQAAEGCLPCLRQFLYWDRD